MDLAIGLRRERAYILHATTSAIGVQLPGPLASEYDADGLDQDQNVEK